MSLQLDGYVRVSRVGGRSGDSFISPDVQREAIQTWAQVMGATIDRFHEDLDESGGSMQRPGLQAVMQRIERRDTGGLVVAKIDRFGRSAAEAGQLVKRILAVDGVFASAAERIDPTSPFGRFGLTIMLAMAELELDRITENWGEAQSRAISRGVHFSVPFGYERDASGRLVPGEHAELVRRAFWVRASGGSWTDVMRRLNNAGATPKAGTYWTQKTVSRMIRSRSYLGEAFHGRHRNPKAHEAIVDEALWVAANNMRGVSVTGSTPSLLTGLVRCSGCRYTLKPDTTGRPGHKVRQYRCRGNHGAGRCPAPATITAHLLDDWVTKRFLARIKPRVRGVQANNDLERARGQLDTAKHRLAEWRDDTRVQEAIGIDQYVAGLQARADEVKVAQAAFDRIATTAQRLVIPPVGDTWDTLTVAEQRKILASVIDCVFLRRMGNAPVSERALILWAGEAPDDLPGKGWRVGQIRPFDW